MPYHEAQPPVIQRDIKPHGFRPGLAVSLPGPRALSRHSQQESPS